MILDPNNITYISFVLLSLFIIIGLKVWRLYIFNYIKQTFIIELIEALDILRRITCIEINSRSIINNLFKNNQFIKLNKI